MVCPTVSVDALVPAVAPNSEGGLLAEIGDFNMNRVGLGLHEIKIDVTSSLGAIPFDVGEIQVTIADPNGVGSSQESTVPATLPAKDATSVEPQVYAESVTTDATTQDHTYLSVWHDFQVSGIHRVGVKFVFAEGSMTSINTIRIGAGDGQSLYFGGAT